MSGYFLKRILLVPFDRAFVSHVEDIMKIETIHKTTRRWSKSNPE